MEEYVIKFKNGYYLNSFISNEEKVIIIPSEIMKAQKFESFQFISGWLRNLNKLSEQNSEYAVDGVYEIIFETNELRVLEKIDM